MDPALEQRRLERVHSEEPAADRPLAVGLESDYRIDLERLRFTPSFARLADVTQVVSSGATDGVVHNRLTHSIKVTVVARSIAVALLKSESPERLAALGGLNHVVCQAAAVAHDLGHPPFGHLGERTLDRLAREEFGLADGFEGNAQTFRIITELEVHDIGSDGLNLTTATRAGVLKYPWGRFHYPDPHPFTWDERPRGAGRGVDGEGSAKFNAYIPDLSEMASVIEALELPPGRQTLECAVMDLADDIAYSLHDLEDFHRSGVLQYSPIASEFRGWLRDRTTLATLDDADLGRLGQVPGGSLERLRRRAETKDGWVYDEELFAHAVKTIGDDFIDDVLARPYDGSMDSDRAISAFVGRWLDELVSSAGLNPQQGARAPLVTVQPRQWHEILVLKFIHQQFVLERPDLAMVQRGQSGVIAQLVHTLDAWLSDRLDSRRAPQRLLDLVDIAELGYRRVRDEQPWLLDSTDAGALARMARGRGIIDFVAGLSDSQAFAYSTRLGAGSSGLLWASGAL